MTVDSIQGLTGALTAAQLSPLFANMVNPPTHTTYYPTGGNGQGTPDSVQGARSVTLDVSTSGATTTSTVVGDTIILKTASGGASSTNSGSNQVGLGVQVFAYQGAGQCWSMNPLVTLTSGCNTAGNVIETDINNFDGDGGPWGNNPAHPYHSFGYWVTGSGPYKCTAAHFITSAGGPQWYQGMWFAGNCISNNTIFDGTNSQVSYNINGSHIIGLDTIGASISDSAVRMAFGHNVTWVNGSNRISISGSSTGLDIALPSGNLLNIHAPVVASDIQIGSTSSMAGPWSTTSGAVSSSSGTLGSASANIRYKKFGRTVFVNVVVRVLNTGTGAGNIAVTLPFACAVSSGFSGREGATTGRGLNGITVDGGNQMFITDSNGNYPAPANNALLVLNGTYEANA